MNFACLATALGIAVTSATAAELPFDALNATDGASTTRQLASGGVYRLVGADVVGKDITGASVYTPNAKGCFNYCVVLAAKLPVLCTAVTWTSYNGGTCWPKATAFQGTPTSPNADAESHIMLDDASSSFIWSATKDGFDMAGFDIDNTRGADMGACMSECNKNGNCFAVTWTNYNGGTCWLKSRASGYVAKAGAKTAYVARKL